MLSTVAFSQSTFDTHADKRIQLFLPIQHTSQQEVADSLQNDLEHIGINQIEVKTAIYWHNFQQGLRQGHLGFYVAPPHFAAWAIANHGFLPLARLAEPLSFVIATNKSDKSLFEIGDLAYKPICSSKPLNLDYLLINNTFEKSVSSAIPTTVDSVPKEMKKAKSACAAFSISNHMLEREARKGTTKYIRLAQSLRTKNYVLVAHPKISKQLSKGIKDYFLSNRGEHQLMPLSLLFSNSGEWVKATTKDYPLEHADGLQKYWQ
jgi:hypothetical protein